MRTAPQACRRWAALLSGLLLCLCTASRLPAQYGYGNVAPSADSTTIYLDSARALAATSPTQAVGILNRALQSAIRHRNVTGEARAYLALGEMQERLGRLTEASESLLRCKRLFGRPAATNYGSYGTQTNSSTGPRQEHAPNDPSILRMASLALTRVYAQAREWEAAYRESESALQLLRLGTDKPVMDALQRQQGMLLSMMGRRKDAEKLLERLVDEAQRAGDARGECEGLIELGEHFLRTNEPAGARPRLEKAEALAGANGFAELSIRAKQGLAAVFKAGGDLAAELAIRNEVVALTNNSANVQSNYLENIAIGNAYLMADQPELAAQYVETGLEAIANNGPVLLPSDHVTNTATCNQPNSLELQVGADAYRQIAEGYLKKNDLEKSLAYYKKYAVLQDSVKAVHARELASAIELSKLLGQNEERVQLLERERALTDKSIELLQQDQAAKGDQILARNLVIGALVGCLLLGAVAGFFLVRNTRARRRADKLLALQSMTGQMNPHFIFNALNSVNAFIAESDERAANRYLSAFSRLMRKVMDDSRHTFIPLGEELEMLRLYLALEHGRFKDQFAYTLDVEEGLEQSDFELPPMMVQPFIENAIWHGLRYRNDGAGRLHIRFGREADTLRITIADNGIGIAQSKAIKTSQQRRQNSMGMRNIETRMALLNEIYAVGLAVAVAETHPGDAHPGTTVRIDVPQYRRRDPIRSTTHPPS